MKKILTGISALFIAGIFMVSCGQVKSNSVSMTDNPFVNASNEQLAKYPVSGFGYKSSRMPAQSWNRWAKVASPIVKGILDKLPSGYELEIRGHADASGPEEPVGNKPGNIKISKDRARAVYNSLKSTGIKSNNLTYNGVGSSELVEGYDSRSGKQRRVTFVIVKK